VLNKLQTVIRTITTNKKVILYILLDAACSTNVDSGACLINHIKKALITTLLKNGDNCDVTNYTHFQLSTLFSKIFEI